MSRLTVLMRFGRVDLDRLAEPFLKSPLVRQVIAFAPPAVRRASKQVEILQADLPDSGDAWGEALDRVRTDYLLVVDGDAEVRPGPFALERLMDVADETGAGMVYADHLVESRGGVTDYPVIDYQLGSVRDEFTFGPLRLYSRKAIRWALESCGPAVETKWSAEYDLRLRISVAHALTRLPEPLYTVVEPAAGSSEEEHFAYVDPVNVEVQNEMEKVVTAHLRRIGAYLAPQFDPVPPPAESFDIEASVIIPVRNRKRTIADAVRSVISQTASFPFNVIVVDNHSTDGTTDILQELAGKDSRIVHLVPLRSDLAIGGCWNEAVGSRHCGRYAVQLDSDDIYAGPDALERIVATLREGPYAMVVGAYRVVDFELNELPPGVVDHREWTRDNGRNNVLRVNGFGAPRGFDTSLLRQHPFPNVSYGEDYAAGLRFSRVYEIGRLFDPVYLCRRWEDNSDAALPVTKVNQYNTYKDRLRTIEILARQKMNQPAG